MARRDAVDSHDPPGWMRDLVHLRDSHCIFPRCQVDARSCDLDHTIPYDENGPPGQTTPTNLAALCRRHHRAKTTGRWRYLRTPDGDHHWHGPDGTTYLVTDRGTLWD
jgi:5-methylcytosine-specific restriction endonuclease McrA